MAHNFNLRCSHWEAPIGRFHLSPRAPRLDNDNSREPRGKGFAGRDRNNRGPVKKGDPKGGGKAKVKGEVGKQGGASQAAKLANGTSLCLSWNKGNCHKGADKAHRCHNGEHRCNAKNSSGRVCAAWNHRGKDCRSY